MSEKHIRIAIFSFMRPAEESLKDRRSRGTRRTRSGGTGSRRSLGVIWPPPVAGRSPVRPCLSWTFTFAPALMRRSEMVSETVSTKAVSP